MTQKTGVAKWVEFFPGVLGLVMVLAKLQPLDGYLGHDYYHAFTRLYIGAVHFWHHGFAVPHYTPYLLGGIPFFADPQSYYYSLPQWLTFFVEPWHAVTLTYLIFYGIGYLGCLRLFQELGFSRRIAHLAAVAFLVNGFTYVNLFVGHLTHHGFLLLPWLIYGLLRTGDIDWRNRFRSACGMALGLCYLFFSGATHILIVFAATGVLLTPWLLLRKLERKELLRFLSLLAMVGGLVSLACAGKLAASVFYGRNFLARSVDTSGVVPWKLVLQYFWFRPDHTPTYLLFGKIWVYGAWEYVGFMPKAIFPLGLLALVPVIQSRDWRRWLVAVATLGLALLVISLAAGNEWNSVLPFFRSYHNPIKLFAAFIPLLPIPFAYGIQWACRLEPFKRLSPPASYLLFFLTGLVFVGEFCGNSDFFVKRGLGIGYPYRPEIWRQLKDDISPVRVASLTQDSESDELGLLRGTSSLNAYEPLFGYRLEAVRSQLVPGPTDRIRDGKFNLQHPGCLIYPDYFHCQAWDRVDETDRIAFENFVDGREAAWGVPFWQKSLLVLGWLTIAGMVLVSWRPWGKAKRLSTPPFKFAEAAT